MAIEKRAGRPPLPVWARKIKRPIYIPPALWKRMRIAAFHDGISISAAFRAAAQMWLESRGENVTRE